MLGWSGVWDILIKRFFYKRSSEKTLKGDPKRRSKEIIKFVKHLINQIPSEYIPSDFVTENYYPSLVLINFVFKY